MLGLGLWKTITTYMWWSRRVEYVVYNLIEGFLRFIGVPNLWGIEVHNSSKLGHEVKSIRLHQKEVGLPAFLPPVLESFDLRNLGHSRIEKFSQAEVVDKLELLQSHFDSVKEWTPRQHALGILQMKDYLEGDGHVQQILFEYLRIDGAKDRLNDAKNYYNSQRCDFMSIVAYQDDQGWNRLKLERNCDQGSTQVKALAGEEVDQQITLIDTWTIRDALKYAMNPVDDVSIPTLVRIAKPKLTTIKHGKGKANKEVYMEHQSLVKTHPDDWEPENKALALIDPAFGLAGQYWDEMPLAQSKEEVRLQKLAFDQSYNRAWNCSETFDWSAQSAVSQARNIEQQARMYDKIQFGMPHKITSKFMTQEERRAFKFESFKPIVANYIDKLGLDSPVSSSITKFDKHSEILCSKLVEERRALLITS
jgi:hypothetical protein